MTTPGLPGIHLRDSENCSAFGNMLYNYAVGIATDSNTTGGIVLGNDRSLCTIRLSLAGSGTIVRHNAGAVDENSGTATVDAAATSVMVNHGLTGTPSLSEITTTPTNNLRLAAKFWISNVTATTFDINVDIAPGASGASFVWQGTIR